MSRRLVYLVSGYLSVLIGCCAALCIYRASFMVYGIGLAMLGFILSGINIFLNTKYQFDEEKIPKGYFGMFLSSLPVLFMLFFIFLHKK